MPISTVSSKGQVTLPVKLRRALGIRTHDKVSIQLEGDAIVVRAVPDFFELEGFLDHGLPEQEERQHMARGVAEHTLGEE